LYGWLYDARGRLGPVSNPSTTWAIKALLALPGRLPVARSRLPITHNVPAVNVFVLHRQPPSTTADLQEEKNASDGGLDDAPESGSRSNCAAIENDS
jgi:hypothetical protein